MTENIKSGKTSKIIWIAGAILLLGLGGLVFKNLLLPPSYKITLLDAPKQVAQGSLATFTWRLDGPPATISHTAVYFGQVSNPGDLGLDVAPENTKYTEFSKEFDQGEFGIPLVFVGNSPMSELGEYFFRVQALINGKNYWSQEQTLTVIKGEYKAVIIDAPAKVTAGTVSTFTWRVDGPSATIPSTAVYVGKTSIPGVLGKDVKPERTGYNFATDEYIRGNFKIPLQFIGNLKIATPGAYFYRVHAGINGENYWSEERTLEAVGTD